MNVVPIKAFSDNYIWALVDPDNGVFDCIDPGEALPVLHFAQEQALTLRSILITHHHPDHIGGVKELKQHYPLSTIYGPTDPRIEPVDVVVHAHEIIEIGGHSYKVLFNPGHTSTHISYFETNKHWLFCGDTLFSGGCGRVFDGTMEQLHQSLLLFKSLPKNTKIFCAHEYTQQNLKFAQAVEPNNTAITHYIQKLNEHASGCSLPSRLEDELLINPFLRTDVNEVLEYALKHGAKTNDSLEVFRVLREQKNIF
jgi:hydroxyacylglutathione hydrolase